MKVLLVSMPFGALDRPALGLSILKAELGRAAFDCDARYLNLAFAELVGCEEYRWVSADLPYTAFAGDWTFTEALYGPRGQADARYVDEILRHTWQLEEDDVERILRIRALVPHFLDHCMQAVPWQDYDAIGFTSTFEQNIASLALARRIKATHPDTTIVFGGANWEGEMGLALHRTFGFVDYVCSGEADASFPALLDRLRTGQKIDAKKNAVAGVVHRRQGRSVFTGPPSPVTDLDARPVPDFSDYFAALDRSSAPTVVTPILVCETSRGCWWGAKSHCTFCGLNGATMAFRRKSPARAVEEIAYLSNRWRAPFIQFADNILDMKYFDTVLEELAALRLPTLFFYEVKANLTRRHVEKLAAAGVCCIQPGIESMSDRILKLMRKGTTALRNIQLLKWCKEFGIKADWNVLYGFPGETRADYDTMLALLRSIRFLDPPSGCGPLHLDRFSPYHSNPRAFGIENVRPLPVYRHLYPVAPERLAGIAYHFEFDYVPQADPGRCFEEVVAFVDEWRREPETGTLHAAGRDPETLVITDTRGGASARYELTGAEKRAYEYCDELRSLANIAQELTAAYPQLTIEPEGIRNFLGSLIDAGLMITDGVHYLALALREPAVGTPWLAPGGSQQRSPAVADAGVN